MAMHLPKPIALYFKGEKSDDSEGLSVYFAADAVVLDESGTFKGLVAIQNWRAETKKKYNHTVEPLKAEERDGRTVVETRVTGNFPGSPVVLDYSFEVKGDKIASLEIG
jgi:hypothetical protein